MVVARKPSLKRDAETGVERYAGTWTSVRTPHHAHPEYQITVSDAGTGRFDYLGLRGEAPAGSLLLFHPGEPHALASTEGGRGWTLRSLHLPPLAIEAIAPLTYHPAPVPLDRDLRAAFDRLWSSFATPAWTAALAALVVRLARRPGVEPPDRERSAIVRRCLDHLAATLDRPVPCAELARVVRVPPARVRRLVLAATGLPPHAWHLQRRIAEAKHRLAAGRAIRDVALGLGFADQAHFTRHFTRLVHVSPSRYASGR